MFIYEIYNDAWKYDKYNAVYSNTSLQMYIKQVYVN